MRQTSGRLIASAAGLGALAPLLLAGGALAAVPVHSAEWTLACDKVSVQVADYNPQFTNRITLTVGGETLLDKKQFGASFSQDFPVKAHTKDVAVELVVTTDEEPKSPVTKTGTVAPCPASPSPTPPPKVTPTPTPPAVSRTPTPKPTGPQLAETGGGSNAGVIAAAGAGVLVIGGALVLVTRRRSR
ncbi:hypothetical protein KCMC57_up19070 [Kitasatospora sp. CMC57]|uniref:Gram-positive cocci surface proteins LPxTG domain-containing protein n=1 Tax=Kitasatospora sp. CMC57 TaxID=3231513 RepID=A0AB33JQN0_9ACTN